jgi:ABC-type bacteriocin/lantibiotic exporter with double-glycine peptidase domain
VEAVAQPGERACGAAALATVLGYWGEQVAPAQLAAAPAAPHGFSAGELRQAARAHGFEAVVFAGDLRDVRRQLDAGRPLIVRLPGGGDSLAHWCVAVGYDADRVFFADPAAGLRAAPAAEFERAWRHSGAAPSGRPVTQAELAALALRSAPHLEGLRAGEPVDFESTSFWVGVGIGGGVMLIILIIVVAV